METALQFATLEELETRIAAGLKTFVDVGRCLLEIRDRRLYRNKGYSRFEDYCREQWGWGKQYAYRQIEAAKTIEIIGRKSPIGDELPKIESQVRELIPLVKTDEQEAINTWRELKERHGDNITAEIIHNAVTEKLKPEASTEQFPSPNEDNECGCWNCKHSETDGSDYDRSWCAARGRTFGNEGYSFDCEYWESEDDAQPEPKPHVSYNSGNNEWYTPPKYIDAASEVMGAIDLDPASSHKANETVGAIKYYTAEDDGLKQEWAGRVFMNPPYATELITKFCEKMARQYADGKVIEAIILVNNATETNWFNTLIEHASAVVFPRSRIRFLVPEGKPGAPLQGQAIIYLGCNACSFLHVFRRFGWGAII